MGSGTDVKLRALFVNTPQISPMFHEDITEYFVRLPADDDQLGVGFVSWDTGQTFDVRIVAPGEKDVDEWKMWRTTSVGPPAADDFAALTDTETTLGPMYGESSHGSVADGSFPPQDSFDPFLHEHPVRKHQRRLAPEIYDELHVPSGETQYSVIKRWFPMDVGNSRLVTIRVKPANGDTTKDRIYRL